MKTTMCKMSRNFIMAIFAILFVSNTVIASAKDPDSSGKEVSVQYLGTVYGQPLFQLNVQNEAGDNLFISLENLNGETLYTQKLTDKFFSKKIQIATTESNISLNLRVYSFKTKQTQVYDINKVTKVSDDLVISQVKH